MSSEKKWTFPCAGCGEQIEFDAYAVAQLAKSPRDTVVYTHQGGCEGLTELMAPDMDHAKRLAKGETTKPMVTHPPAVKPKDKIYVVRSSPSDAMKTHIEVREVLRAGPQQVSITTYYANSENWTHDALNAQWSRSPKEAVLRFIKASQAKIAELEEEIIEHRQRIADNEKRLAEDVLHKLLREVNKHR